MTMVLQFLLNSTSAALIIFTAAAAIASGFVKSPVARIAIGGGAILLTFFAGISTRSLFTWTVSAVERPSIPGLVLLIVLAIATIRGQRIGRSAEFRFATMMFAIAGLVLYPGATGFIDRDTYVMGYSGYLLPSAVALVIAYAIFRGYVLTALTLNIAIAAFLLGAGESNNFWDYVMDPIAWFIGCGTWIAIASGFAITRILGLFKSPASIQPSSGIGETPISH